MVPSQPFAERLTKRDRPRRLLLTVLTRPVRPVLAVLPTPCSSSTQTRLLVCGLTPLLSWSWLLASSSLLLLCMSLRNSPPSSLLKSMFFNIILCSLSLSQLRFSQITLYCDACWYILLLRLAGWLMRLLAGQLMVEKSNESWFNGVYCLFVCFLISYTALLNNNVWFFLLFFVCLFLHSG